MKSGINSSPSISSSRTHPPDRAGSAGSRSTGNWDTKRGSPLRRPFATRDSTHHRGRKAERAGERWLLAQGYRIVARNYRTPVGEIDLIGQEGDVLCFVEIKARTSSAYGPALCAITPRQQSRVARAASLYVQRSGWDGACRFDALGLDWTGKTWAFTLLRDAFPAR